MCLRPGRQCIYFALCQLLLLPHGSCAVVCSVVKEEVEGCGFDAKAFLCDFTCLSVLQVSACVLQVLGLILTVQIHSHQADCQL